MKALAKPYQSQQPIWRNPDLRGYETARPKHIPVDHSRSTARQRRGMLYGDPHYAYKAAHELIDKDRENHSQSPEHQRNLGLAEQIWQKLQFHYPGHPWGVGVSHEQGIAQIFMPTFTAWSYVIRLQELFSDPGMRMVVRGGGDMLERFNLPRSGFSTDQYVSALRNWRPDFNYKRKPG